MTTHFIVHDKKDTVGVIVVEDVKPEMNLTGWIMETDETITLKSLDPVPLGHKIALRDIKSGDTVLKYGHDVGRAVSDVGKGHHVHVHNRPVVSRRGHLGRLHDHVLHQWGI